MEFLRERQRMNSRALQVYRKRLHFTASIGQMCIANPRRHESAALHSNLQPAQNLGGAAKRIVGAIEAVQPARMIFFIETLRPDQQVQIAEGALNFDSLMVWSGCWNSRYCVRKGAQRGPRRNVWM